MRSPTSFPSLWQMLDDLAWMPIDQIAEHLGCTRRTLERWRATDTAPRAVMVAVFWETKWGRATSETEAHNYGQIHAGLARALQKERAALLRRIGTLEQLLDEAGTEASNAPFFTCAS